ncbi:cytochrome oxidase c subunit VIb-domain-containing protein [Suillus variegatus]|nr:cytochrome oxidase c subunit VIb-domain-containing protein [Suillus variegatus]
MSWFSRSSSEQSPAATRHDRQKCWESRDQYFECLDSAGVLTAGEEGTACTKSKFQYEKSCAKSWIDYFNKRRVLAEKQKDMLAQSQLQSQEVNRKL